MSDIGRLYEEIRKAVPRCEYVRVSHWNLRTTWEAVPRDGHSFTRKEHEAIEQIFAAFVPGEEEDEQAAAAAQAATAPELSRPSPLHARMTDLERRVLTLEMRLSALLDNAGTAH